jgi:hypothetical protein
MKPSRYSSVRQESNQKKNTHDPEHWLKLFIKTSILLLIIIFLHLDGEFLGFITLLAGLALAYKTARYVFSELTLEKLIFITAGIYFTAISLFSLLLQLLGLKLSVGNLLILSIASLLIVTYLSRARVPCRVVFDKMRFIAVVVSFTAAMFLYLWPSMPSFVSPCTFGFDCNLHVDSMINIYSLERFVPPVLQWRYYPYGLHVNGALLAHALGPDMSSYGNSPYLFVSFLAAASVAMLAGMLCDRLKNKLYIIVFLLAILSSIYPASALIEFGYWSNIFGIYYIILVAYVMPEFIKNPKQIRMNLFLVLIAGGAVIAYQLLTALVPIFTFLLVSLTLVKESISARIKTAVIFLLLFGLFYCVYTLEGYSRFLTYNNEPVKATEYFQNMSKGDLEIRMNGTRFTIRANAVRTENLYAPPGFDLSGFISKGLDWDTFNEYLMLGKSDISGPSGAVLFHDIKWTGLLIVFLLVVGMAYSYSSRDYTLVFIEASILHLFLFYRMFINGEMNDYYFSKVFYYFIYPASMYAAVGFEGVMSLVNQAKKRYIALMVIMVILLSLGFNFLDSEKSVVLIGEKKNMYETQLHWSLLEFNRYLRYWDMSWGIKRSDYGFMGWLKMMNLSAPIESAIQERHDYVSSGVWNAADFPQHDLGKKEKGGYGWTSTAGGFGYMIGRKYMELDTGSYTAIFTIKVDDNSRGEEQSVYIEIAKGKGVAPISGRILQSKDFNANDTYQGFELNFNLTAPVLDAEFRAHYEKSQQLVTIQKIELRKN